jgi:hypothetical protein
MWIGEVEMRQYLDNERNTAPAMFAGNGDVEPLEPRSWFRMIGKLAAQLEGAPSDRHEPLLRHAYHLLELAPRPLRGMIRSDLTAARYEQLLDCGALESAVVGLVGHPMAYEVARLRTDLHEAEVRLPGQVKPTLARGPSAPIALLAAWTQCLASLNAAPAEAAES